MPVVVNQFVDRFVLKMKVKLVLIVLFGALTIGHNKPMSLLADNENRIVVYRDRNARFGYTPVHGDVSEFCQNISAGDNSGRTVPVLHKVLPESITYILSCEVGENDVTTALPNDGNISDQNENTSSQVTTNAPKNTDNTMEENDNKSNKLHSDSNLDESSTPTENLSDESSESDENPWADFLNNHYHSQYNDDDEAEEKVMYTPINNNIDDNFLSSELLTAATQAMTTETVLRSEELHERTVIPHKVIKDGYTYVQSVDSWMKLHFMPTTWSNARLQCLREGSTLASPVDLAMLEAMTSLANHKVFDVFTGISENYAPGLFYSVEGVSLDNIPAKFGLNEPNFNQDVNEPNVGQCVSMDFHGTMRLSNCDTLKSFICYVKDSEVPQTQSPCGTDPDYIYENRTGQCYKFHSFPKVWSSAFMTCATEGGHLAIVNSEVEAQALVDLVNKYPESSINSDAPAITLLGFRDWSDDNTWMTIHGQTLQKAGYSRWGQNEPNNPGTERCGSMFRSGELNNTICKMSLPFICEKKPDDVTKMQKH